MLENKLVGGSRQYNDQSQLGITFASFRYVQHIYMHAYMNTFIRTHRHIHIYIYANIYAHTHAHVQIPIDIHIHAPGSTRGRKKSFAEKAAALHGCKSLILACSTGEQTWVRRLFVGIPLRFVPQTCQQNVNMLRVWYALRCFYVGPKSNMKPTKCQHTPTHVTMLSTSVVDIDGFMRSRLFSSWLPENVSASQTCQEHFENQNTAFSQTNLDFPNRREKSSVGIDRYT